MQKLVKDYLNELSKQQKKRRKIGVAVTLLVVLVIGSVVGVLMQYGVAMTGDAKCGIEEHTHTEECYTDELVCGQEEGEGHIHTDECYEMIQELICGQEESEEHAHTEECYREVQGELVCGQDESEGHTHTEDCYEEQLTCGKEEHVHTDACYIDRNADVEDASMWDAQYADTEWKGAWGEDLVTAAKAQIGYKESSDNYVGADDGSHKGYTRYGQFADDAYTDWDAAFVNFCMYYAGLEALNLFPKVTDTADWYNEFQNGGSQNSDYLAAPQGYEPKAGDIIFMVRENEERDSQMGVVSSYDNEKNEVKVIEGNSDNEVKENGYSADGAHVVAYLKMSEMEEAYKNGSDAQDEEQDAEAEEEAAADGKADEGEAGSEKRTMTAEGPDYTVTVSFTEEAGIPEEAILDVREIEQDSEEYQKYYEQSLEAVEADDLSFARCFDITFLVDGKKIEPKAPVEVMIGYQDAVEMQAEDEGKIVHFADKGIEVLDADVDSDGKEFKYTQESFSVVFALVRANNYVVLNPYNIAKDGNSTLLYRFNVDGTAGTVSKNKRIRVEVGNATEVTLPDEGTRQNGFQLVNGDNNHTIKNVDGYYPWKLVGWYNIGDKTYYNVSNGPVTAQIQPENNNVFYAHWVAPDEAFNNGGAQSVSGLGSIFPTEDTSSFATIEMFDYDELFNLTQIDVEQEGITSEKWGMKADDDNPFTFYSTESWHNDTYPDLAGVGRRKGDNVFGKGKVDLESDPLLQRLFNVNANTDSEDGVRYLGPANNLFYKTTDGYYEYDSDQHAAFYNKADERFYVYDKPQKWPKAEGQENIFLPLNSASGVASRDDCRRNNDYAKTNYWFGMKTEFNFWLPDNSNYADKDKEQHGANQNNGNDMIFSFSGDDDVWVFVDGVKVLDLSGIHGRMDGTINFSIGEVETQTKEATNTSPAERVKTQMPFAAGSHTMTVYYMERGRGGSNCKIRFNFLPSWKYEGAPCQEVSVEKKWKDSDNKETSPDMDSINVELKEGTGSKETKSLSRNNNWACDWKYLDKDETYSIEEQIGDKSNSYVTQKSSEESACGYWVESSNLENDDTIIIGSGYKENPLDRIVFSYHEQSGKFAAENAQYAANGDVLQDGDGMASAIWNVCGITQRGSQEHLQFKLKLKETDKYLYIGGAEPALVDNEREASYLHFSEKGNLTGASKNRLVWKASEGITSSCFEVVAKESTATDAVDPNTGKGSYRRVHIYKYDSSVGTHTHYTITNTKVEANIVLEKVNKNQPSDLLKGAEFELYFGEKFEGAAIYKDRIQDADVSGTTDGKIEIGRLPVGIYWLKETKAPGGFMLLKDPIKITVSKNPGELTSADGVVSVDYQIEGWNSVLQVANKITTIKVPNTMIYSLPETGGTGIYWYMFSGILLMAGAALLTYKKRCREVLKG